MAALTASAKAGGGVLGSSSSSVHGSSSGKVSLKASTIFPSASGVSIISAASALPTTTMRSAASKSPDAPPSPATDAGRPASTLRRSPQPRAAASARRPSTRTSALKASPVSATTMTFGLNSFGGTSPFYSLQRKPATQLPSWGWTLVAVEKVMLNRPWYLARRHVGEYKQEHDPPS